MNNDNIDIYLGIYGPYIFTEFYELIGSKKTLFHTDELLLINLLIKTDRLRFYVEDDEVFPKKVFVMKYIEPGREDYYISENPMTLKALVEHGDGIILRNLNKAIYNKTLERIEELEKKQTHTNDGDILESITGEIDRLSGRKKLVSKWFIKHRYESDIMSPKPSKRKKTKISVMREMVGKARNDKEENALRWKNKIYELEPNIGSRSGMLCKIKEETEGEFAEGGMAWYMNSDYYFSVGRPKKK